MSTTPGTFGQEVSVAVLASLALMWITALLLPPAAKILRTCFGSARIHENYGSTRILPRYLIIATAVGTLAAMLGLVFVDLLAISMPSQPAFLRAIVAYGGVLAVFLIGRQLIKRRSEPISRVLLPLVAVVLLLGGFVIHRLTLSTDLPIHLDTGNRSPVASHPSWIGSNPPNVLLIVLDTTRLDRLSAYGYGLPTSPYLEQIGAEGTVFDRAISTAPWTLPSHASMFTGLMPRVHQATEEHRMLRNQFTTLAEILLQHGYETVGFSSNSVVGRSHNLQQGFQQFYEVAGDVWHRSANPIQELIVFKVLERISSNIVWKDKGATRVNQLAQRWLDGWQRRDDPRPFFVFVNYLEAHLPYRPPATLRKKFGAETLRPAIAPLVTSKFHHGDIYRLIGYQSLLDGDDYEQLGTLYDASLAYQDARLGELLEDVRGRGILDDTVVIIVSDHGENLGDHNGLLGHAFSVHQTLVHVPLIVRYPQVFEAGVRHQGLVSIASIFQTALDLSQAQPDPSWPPNVGPLPIDGEAGADFAFSEYSVPIWELYNLAVEARGVDVGPMIVRKRSIQTLEWKVIQPSVGVPSLYHLAEDLNEDVPLDASGHLEGERLLLLLDTHLGTLHRPTLPAIDHPSILQEDTREALRALGYIQ